MRVHGRQVRVTVSAKHVLSDLRALAKEHLRAHLRAAKEHAEGPRAVAAERGESEGGESEQAEGDAADVDVDVALVAKGRDGLGLAGTALFCLVLTCLVLPCSCFLLPAFFLLLSTNGWRVPSPPSSCFWLLMCPHCHAIAASSCY